MKKIYALSGIIFIIVLSNLIISSCIFQKGNSGVEVKSKNQENNLTDTKTISRDTSQIDYIKLHEDALVVDTHNDFIWKVVDKGADFSIRNDFTQSGLPRLKEGGVDVQVLAVWIPMSEVKRSYDFTVSQISKLKQIETENSGEFEFAKTYDDIIRITNEKKICGLIGVEGGTVIEKNLDNINKLFELGVRYIGLTWNNSNSISTSAKDETEKGNQSGLTEFGADVVRRMNEVGMLIDVSHLSEKGFYGVIDHTTSPIIASHSNCYTINPHFRNLTDDQIKAIAKVGGYIGINFHDDFLDKDGKQNGTDLEKVIEHIDYIKKLVGAEYVGLGSDFDGGINPPSGLKDATYYPEITRRLVEKGYSEEDIRKILGLNFLRVFKKVCG